MNPGKLASQAIHASRLSLLKFIKENPSYINEFIDLNSAGSVVVLRGKNAECLMSLYEQANSMNFPTALFEDSGHIMLPHFDGSKTITALAIGPALKADMYPLTKKLRMVK